MIAPPGKLDVRVRGSGRRRIRGRGRGGLWRATWAGAEVRLEAVVTLGGAEAVGPLLVRVGVRVRVRVRVKAVGPLRGLLQLGDLPQTLLQTHPNPP